MSVLIESLGLRGHIGSGSRRIIPAIVLLAICLASWPGAGYGANELPTTTSVYVFLPGRGEVHYSDPSAGISETYEIEGEFQMYADLGSEEAWFEKVDGKLIESSGSVHGDDLDDVFRMTDLDGIIIHDSLIVFTGHNWDGDETTVRVTFMGD
jgi:hypothetical protein